MLPEHAAQQAASTHVVVFVLQPLLLLGVVEREPEGRQVHAVELHGGVGEAGNEITDPGMREKHKARRKGETEGS